jgi:hypothetical protein
VGRGKTILAEPTKEDSATIDRRRFVKTALATPLLALAPLASVKGDPDMKPKMEGNNASNSALNDTQEIHERLKASLEMFRKELAASQWSQGKSYRHLESLVQELLGKTYFSPHHTFVPLPDEVTTLRDSLQRLNQVIWILSGKSPSPDFELRFHIRPYHPAYFIRYFEETLPVDNQNRLDDVVTRMKANLDREVEIVQGLDDVCATCDLTDIYRCIKDADNQRHWDGVNDKLLAKQGLRYGQRILARDLMKNAVKTMPTWEDTCGVCEAKEAQTYAAGRQGWMKLLA